MVTNFVKDLFGRKTVTMELIFLVISWAVVFFVNVVTRGSDSDMMMFICIIIFLLSDLSFVIAVYVEKVPSVPAKRLHHSVTLAMAAVLLIKLIFYFCGQSDSWPEPLKWGLTANIFMAIYLALRFARGAYRHYRLTEE
jgi:FlaA1/EpsC-like NDP-sugar epimerase